MYIYIYVSTSSYTCSCKSSCTSSWPHSEAKLKYEFGGKMITITLYARQQETQMYTTVFWTLWESERVGWFGRMALKHVTSCKKWIASPGSMQDIGCSGLVHWDDLEGWHREESWRGVQDGEHMYTHGWFMSIYGKNHHNIVMQLASN